MVHLTSVALAMTAAAAAAVGGFCWWLHRQDNKGKDALSPLRSSPDSKFTWKNYLLTALTFAAATGFPILHFVVLGNTTHTWYVYAAHIAALVGIYAFDHYAVSTGFQDTLDNLKNNGYSLGKVLTYSAVNLIAFQFPAMLMMTMLNNDPATVWRYNDPTVWALGLAVGLASDVPFYLLHRLMHVYHPGLHHLHHCAVRATTAVNMLFNPIDLSLEFGAPVLFIFLMNVYGFNEPFAFVVSNTFVSAWYLLSHDEWVQLQHVRHHRYCSSNYYIYFDWFPTPKGAKDAVRGMIKPMPRNKGE